MWMENCCSWASIVETVVGERLEGHVALEHQGFFGGRATSRTT
jgi:hypothetical protein